jgi:hypothetical protein
MAHFEKTVDKSCMSKEIWRTMGDAELMTAEGIFRIVVKVVITIEVLYTCKKAMLIDYRKHCSF